MMVLNQFKNLDLTDIASQSKIIAIFTEELKNSKADKLQCATDLFSQLFQCLSFNFKDLLKRWKLTQNQKSEFVSYLLYCLYYYELPLGALASINTPHELEYFLYTMAAESLQQKKLITLLKSLPAAKQLHLTSYCSVHIREGTWKIFNLLTSLNEQSQEWKKLSKHLRTKYYNGHYLYKILSEHNHDINSILNELEADAEKQIREIKLILPLLLDSIINSPLAFIEALKSNPYIDNEQIVKSSRQAHENLKQMFSLYSDEDYSFGELSSFFRSFGLKGHILDNSLIKNNTASLSLISQLKALLDIFQKPWDIPGEENRQFILFALSICQQLFSFHRTRPSPYAHGLQLLVFALSTRGNNLEELPWLPSVLDGLENVKEHLQKPLKLNPIIVFDQATPKAFKKNDEYIKSLAQKFHAEIWHLSNKQTLQIAKKLGIETLIKTSEGHNFGFGGARNCELLLAPVIAGGFQQGCSSIDELLKLNKKDLKSIYERLVLGKESQDLFIHLGEDDVAIPTCNIFSDALFANSCKDLYFNRSVECIGRITHELYAFLDLKNVLEMPSTTFNQWSNTLFKGSMKGMLTKPKFCLPMPIGNEELHVILPKVSYIHFLQPDIHLAGTRFPQKEIPESPWDGILESLKQQVPYRFDISTSSTFTDSRNLFGRNIFPWNDAAIRNSQRILCLNDLWNYAASQEVREELKRRFWDNVEFVFQVENSQLLFRQCLAGLSEVNYDADVPQPLLDYFKMIQHEAQMFTVLAELLLAERASGSTSYLKNSLKRFENQFKVKASQTILCKGFLTLIDAIENFGKSSLNIY